MPDPLTRFQRYRQWAIEYRARAEMAGDDRQRAEYVKLAIRYEEIADAAEQVACLFRCPTTGAQVQGFIAEEETSGNDPNSYEPVNCLDCGQIHLVNFRTGETVGKRNQPRSISSEINLDARVGDGTDKHRIFHLW